MEPVVAFFERLIPGASTESISRSLGVIIAIALLAFSTAVAIANGAGNSGGGGGGSSDDTPPGVLLPGESPIDLSRGEADEQIRKDLFEMIEKSRHNAGMDPHIEAFDTVLWAKQHADRNAQSQRYNKVSRENIVALQARLPYEEASAEKFYANWLAATDSHCALASDFDNYGVGVASADGTTYAVIYIRNITAEHEACVNRARTAGNSGSS